MPSSTSAASSTCPSGASPRRWRKPTRAGWLGEGIAGSAFALDIVVYRGAGSYVCGEASGLLTSLEGQQGLSAQPAAAPHGARPLPAADRRQQRRDPGQHHRHRPRRRGGVPQGRHGEEPGNAADLDLRPRAAAGRLRGGVRLSLRRSSSARIAAACSAAWGSSASSPAASRPRCSPPPRSSRCTLDHASVAAAGSGLGSGGMVVVAEGTCMVRFLQVLVRFYHHESCGQCTPCREGMGWLHRIVDRIVAGEGAARRTSTGSSPSPRPTTAPRSAAWAMPPATPPSASSPSTATSSSTGSRTAARCYDGRLEAVDHEWMPEAALHG